MYLTFGFGMAQAAIGAEQTNGVSYKTVEIDELESCYREAGNAENPTIFLLHGFPTSFHMFRNLIPALADRFHLIAPGYPGYGYSAMPSVEKFKYSFDNIARIIEKFIDDIGLPKKASGFFSVYIK